MIVFWAVATGAFLVLEAVTAAMTSIWFCAGSAAALIAAACRGPLWLQIILFVAVSAACFIFLYPKLKQYINRNKHATNADMTLGQVCVVTETVDNLAATGTAEIGGKSWTARSADESILEAGTKARVERIEGVKLILTGINE